MKIGLILGSTRQERMVERVAKFIRRTVEKEHTAVIFDPLDMDLPQTQQSMNWFFNPSAVPDNIKQLNDEMAQCDALVAVTAEYNMSIPPALSNIVDNIPPTTFTWKPCAIVSYSVGTVGGWRAAMQVRQLMGAVGCTLTQKQMGIPVVRESLDDDGKPKDEKLQEELDTTMNQLFWLARAINNHKAAEKAPSFAL